MSWQAYIDSSLLGTGQVSRAGIYGLDGSKWASSAGFEPAQSEIVALVKGMNDPSPFYGSGVRIAGTKYTFLRSEPGRSIYARLGSDAGCVVVKTTQAIIVGLYENGIPAGACTNVVEKLGDYLVQAGY
eukprot:m.31757 g.31757  ORF g.31757 m.31757 type:complete len:129 (+) comp5398_c1_seq1:131-517(+)